MLKFLILLLSFSLSVFSFADDKREFVDTINSNLDFYNKIDPGMGFKGEMISRALDEEGNYLNCTIALRGQYIVINTSLDPNLIYVYQNHWVDINIEAGNTCDPSMYEGMKNRFVHTDKRRNVDEVLRLMERSDVSVEKIAEKVFVIKYIVPASEENEEFEVVATYNLNRPLFMNPDMNGFKNQYFEYTNIDLSSIKLCPPTGEEGECIEDQDLSYLIE